MRMRLPMAAALVVLLPACYNPDKNPEDTEGDTGSGSGATDPTNASQPTATSVGPTSGDTTSGPSTATDGPTTGDDATTAAGIPEITVRVDGNEVQSGDAAPLPGTADVDATGELSTVTIANAGDGPLSLGGVLFVEGDEDDFVIDSAGAAGMVAPGDTATFEVGVSPQTGGLHSMTVRIANDDDDEGDFLITFLGHSTPNTYRPLLTGTSPPARFDSALANLDDGRLLLFGGTGANSALRDDTWVFDVEAETWTELNLATAPSVRHAHGMANGRVVLFGGEGSNGLLGDTWLFSTSTDTWTMIAPTTPPTARSQHAMTEIPDGALLFGGFSPTGGVIGDTWRFDGVSFSWTSVMAGGMAPAARRDAAMRWDGQDTVVLYGGYGGGGALDDTREFSLAGEAWGPNLAGVAGARGSMRAGVVAGNRVGIYSGKTSPNAAPSPGTYGFDPATDTWSDLMANGEPAPRHSYALASVALRNKVIIFGGMTQPQNPASAVSATYEYVGPLPPMN